MKIQRITITLIVSLITVIVAQALNLALGKVYGPLAAFALALGLQLTSYLGSTPIFMVGGVSDSLLGLRLSSEAIIFQFCGFAALITIELFLAEKQQLSLLLQTNLILQKSKLFSFSGLQTRLQFQHGARGYGLMNFRVKIFMRSKIPLDNYCRELSIQLLQNL